MNSNICCELSLAIPEDFSQNSIVSSTESVIASLNFIWTSIFIY